MFKLKQLSLSAATIVLTAMVGILYSTAAQAAIVGGRVSGTWQSAVGGVNGLDVGTDFTADYTYDSASLVTTDVAGSTYTKYLVSSAPLLSLVVNSGAFSYSFDLSGDDSFQLLDILGGPISSEYASTGFSVFASEGSGSTLHEFSANKTTGQFDNNKPFDGSFARIIYNNSNGFSNAQTNAIVNGSIPPSGTPVPTPALLPGLVGLGMAALRKWKNQGQEVAETAQS
jgi:hypothetical protein